MDSKEATFSSPSRTVFAVDWDGTCVEEIWPGMGGWLPGAIEALRWLVAHGKTVIYTVRIKPQGLDDVTLREPGAADAEWTAVRDMLNAENLQAVDIYPTGKGKPPARYYIDDRALEFNGDWDRILKRIKGEAGRDKVSRNPLSARFHEILEELGELHDLKQEDYGRDSDPFANVRASEEWGISPWVGAMVRATDKLRRLQTFAQKGVLKNESVDDSLRDLAVYAVIALVLFEEERQTT